jgi:penicillin amidase
MLGTIFRFVLTRMSRRRLPQIEGELQVPGLREPVEVLRDRWNIPHIFAKNTHDLFFAQGFVHAQERLWQMELNRRTANGKLSALFGEIALDTDRASRTFGFLRLGQKDWENTADEFREVVQAYCDGVNAFLQQPSSRFPVEFSLLRHRPEPWKPEDSLAFARLMVWQLSQGWYGEIIRTRLVDAVGAEHAAELEITYPESNPITLPDGIDFNILNDDSLLKAQGPFLDRGKGSNAWAVSGQKTTTGSPILCNDMHLHLSLPAIWFAIHLVAEEYDVSGVSLPGVPLVMVGHNSKIAWGMTLAFTDAQDLFIEKIKDDSEHPKYEYCGEWLDAELIAEEISVKGRTEPQVEKVIITRHGPIISDVIGHSHQRLAVNSMALRPSPVFKGWMLLNKAACWDDFVEAMRFIEAPPLNVAYADVDGNIGYWVTGKVPIRSKGDGRVPVPGWTGEYEWVDDVPFEKMPHAFNPQEGYVVTCNHRIIPDDYPYWLGADWMNGYRARRIIEIFKGKEKLSSDDFKALHLDFMCIPGLEFVSRLKNLESDDSDIQIALDLLLAWDGILSPTNLGGTVYEVTRYFLVRNLLEPGLGKELTDGLMGLGFNPVLYSSHEFYGHDTVAMLRLLDNSESWWVKQVGGRDAILKQSLKDAVKWIKKNLGKNTSKWQWGRLHRVTFAHAMALKKPLDKVFNRGPFPIGGDTDTVCQTAINPADPYEMKFWAPSHRQIIDMGDLSRSLLVYPPGQSGHLGSQHYDDLIDPWRKGKYCTILRRKEELEAELEGKLILRP